MSTRAKSSSHVQISGSSRGKSINLTVKSGQTQQNEPDFYRLCYEENGDEASKDENENETATLIKQLQKKYPKTSITSIQVNEKSIKAKPIPKVQTVKKAKADARPEKIVEDKKQAAKEQKSVMSNTKKSNGDGDKKINRVSNIRAKFQMQVESNEQPATQIKSPRKTFRNKDAISVLKNVQAYETNQEIENSKTQSDDEEAKSIRKGRQPSNDVTNEKSIRNERREKSTASTTAHSSSVKTHRVSRYNEIRDGLLRDAGLPVNKKAEGTAAKNRDGSPFVRVVLQDVTRRRGSQATVKSTDGCDVSPVSTGTMRYNNEATLDVRLSKLKISAKYQTTLIPKKGLTSPFVKTIYQDCESPLIARRQAQTSGRSLDAFEESVIISSANCYKEQVRHDRVHFRRLRRSRTERYKSDPLDSFVRDNQQQQQQQQQQQNSLWHDVRQQRRLSGGHYKSEGIQRTQLQQSHSGSQFSGPTVVRSASMDNLFSWIQSQAKLGSDHHGDESYYSDSSSNLDTKSMASDSVIIERAKMVRLDTAKTLMDGATSPNSIRRSTALREKSVNRLSLSSLSSKAEAIVEKDENEADLSSNPDSRNSQPCLDIIPTLIGQEVAVSISCGDALAAGTADYMHVDVGQSSSYVLKAQSDEAATAKNREITSTTASDDIQNPSSDTKSSKTVSLRRKQFEIVGPTEVKTPETSQAIVRKLYRNKTFDYSEMAKPHPASDDQAAQSVKFNLQVDYAKNTGLQNDASDKRTVNPAKLSRSVHELPHADDHVVSAHVTKEEHAFDGVHQDEAVTVSTLRSLFEVGSVCTDLKRSKSLRLQRSPSNSAGSHPRADSTSPRIVRKSSHETKDETRPSNAPTSHVFLDEPQKMKLESNYHGNDQQSDLIDSTSCTKVTSLSMETTNASPKTDASSRHSNELRRDCVSRKSLEKRSRQSFVVDNVLYASPGEELVISSGFHSLPGRHRRVRAVSSDADTPSTACLPSKHPSLVAKRSITLKVDLKNQTSNGYSLSDNQINRGYDSAITDRAGSFSQELLPRQDAVSNRDDTKPAVNIAMVAPMVVDPVTDESDRVDAMDRLKETDQSSCEGTQPEQFLRKTSRPIRIEILVGQQEQICVYDIKADNIDSLSTWRDFEAKLKVAFEKHIESIESNYLEITSDDIHKLRVGRHEVALGEHLDVNFLLRERTCQILLKGGPKQLASLSYETLLPKSHIAKFLSLILTNHFVIFYGPSGTGKSFFASKLVQVLERRFLNDGVHIDVITVANINREKWQELLNGCLMDVSPKRPTVLLLDGFSHAFMEDVEHISHFLDRLEFKGIYVVGTVTQSSAADVPTDWQKQFRWVWLPNHEEPVKGMLRRHLRREIIQIDDRSRWPELFNLADWLQSLWKHVNSYIEKYNEADLAIGPTMFFSCPLNMTQSEEWFVDLWNYSIVPYFLHTVKKGIRLYGQPGKWKDPLDWILSTYPWACPDEGKHNPPATKLRRIRVEDVGVKDIAEGSQSVSSDDQDRLMDFLRRLETFVEPEQEQVEEEAVAQATNQRTQTITRSRNVNNSRSRPYLESAL